EHSGAEVVDAEQWLSRYDRLGVNLLSGCADDLEFFLILNVYRFGHRYLGCRRGHFAIGSRLAASLVVQDAGLGSDLFRRYLPCLRGSLLQHMACRCAGHTQCLPPLPDGLASANKLSR